MVDWLAPARIRAELKPAVSESLPIIEVQRSVDSTNAELLRRVHALESGTVCLAEQQTAGRGRRGRTWESPLNANLYLSLLWRFPCKPAQLLGLSPLTGIALARALRERGAQVVLKWPNDLFWRGRKLGGILVEIGGAGPCHTVTGIGLNVAMPDDAVIDQPWTDLQRVLRQPVSRNHLAAGLLNELVPAYQSHTAPLSGAWAEFDALADQPVVLHSPAGRVSGIARGITDTGALRLETGGSVQSFHIGEVSLRLA